MELYVIFGFLFLCGVATGGVSALLGVGGGTVIFPVIWFMSKHEIIAPLKGDAVTGLSALGALFSSLCAFLVFRRARQINRQLIIYVGIGLIPMSLVGGAVTKLLSERAILIIFISLVLFSALSLIDSIRVDRNRREIKEKPLHAVRMPLFFLGCIIGFFSGIAGLGGSGATIAFVTRFFRIPLRRIIGSGLGIATITFSSALIGKIATRQVPFSLAPPILLGVVFGVPVGYWLNRRVSVKWLKVLFLVYLAVVICETARYL